MPEDPHPTPRTTALVVIATVAVAFALYFGREILVPIAFALLLNALFRPVVRSLEKLRLPTPIAAAIVTLALLAAFVGIGWALSNPLQDWFTKAPESFSRAQGKLEKLRKPVQQVTKLTNQLQQAAQGPPTSRATNPATNPAAEEPPAQPPAQPPAPRAPSAIARFLGTTTTLLGQIVEVIVLLYLLLAAGDMFLQKLVKVMPLPRDKVAARDVVHEAEAAVLRYMLVTALINAGQGVIVALVLWWLKVPSPLLWAVFTFVLEFIPYLGATIMVGLLAVTGFATFDGMWHILAVPGSYLIITTLQNNVVSPIAYGQRLKLNPVAVLVGVILWWFLWGIAGAFLAVPIIATVKIISDHSDNLTPLAEFLGE